jgi:IS30 family transposase
MSDETIYHSIYVQGRGALRRELEAALRNGRAIRAGDQPGTRGRTRGTIMISERPPEAGDRAVPGHWEGDLLMGKDGASAIGTLVERSTRFVLLLHLGRRRDATAVAEAMTEAMTTLLAQLRRSLTWDQNNEQAAQASQASQIGLAAEPEIYFSDPRAPWQPGSNENTNGLLRQYFPKGTALSRHSKDHLEAVAAQLNGRPRKTLGWRTPTEALNDLLGSPPDRAPAASA